MNTITINLEILRENLDTIHHWMEDHGSSWTLVTKCICGHGDTMKALQSLGVKSIADSRVENLEAIKRIIPEFESWYLRPPHLSAIPEIVRLSDVSLNSEIEIIKRLDEEARKLDRRHGIIVMIELGDLREGILPGSLVGFYDEIFTLANVEVLGIGANLGCLSGTVPSIDQLTQLVLYRELLELKFKRKLPLISAGSSALLPLLLERKIPKAVNHFRIGESVFLGSDLVNGGTLKGLRNDAVTLHAEVVEIKEKSLVPMGETTGMTPFEPLEENPEQPQQPGLRGYRAIISLGQLDTEISGLTPVNPGYEMAGASSDLSVVNVGSDAGDLCVGDTISFRVDYSALVRSMSSNSIGKRVVPDLVSFKEDSVTESLDLCSETPVLEETRPGRRPAIKPLGRESASS